MEPSLRFRAFPAQAAHSRLAVGVLVLLLSCAPLPQATAQAPAPSAPYTFHVYEDLVQLPTLVLDTADNSYPNLKASDFAVTLDGGPVFHPRHVRLEGDDPISLTLLLDLSTSDANRIARQLSAASASIPNGWLMPHDHISIFAVDCSLVRSTFDAPFSQSSLETGVQTALASPLLKQKPAGVRGCTSTRLWDTIAGVVSQVSQLPGRRVVLLLTNGIDHHSSNTWKTLEIYAGKFNVTLIGVQPIEPLLLLRSQFSGMEARKENEDIFKLLCFTTGGTVLSVESNLLQLQLQRAITLLRQRYILEFARPANGVTGLHAVEVHIADANAIVRPAGITFPMQDKALTAAPTTLRSDPTRAPVFGDRKVLTQPQ